MRLIDADPLEKRFEYLETVGNDLAHKVTEEEKGRRIAYHLAKYETHVAPTIDSESLRPQGKWSGMVCSNCGESTSFYYDCNYCPNCGAKMEQEDDNETD